MAAFSVALALIISRLLWTLVSAAPFIILLGTTFLNARRGGVGPGMFSAVLGGFGALFILVPAGDSPEAVTNRLPGLIVFLIIALVVSWLEQKRVTNRQALSELKDDLSVILHTVGEGIIAQDADGNTIFANSAVARIVGYKSAEEMVGVPVTEAWRRFEIFDERNEPVPESNLPHAQAPQQKRPVTRTLVLREVGTQTERWVEVTAAPVFDEAHDLRRVVSVVRDITGRVQAERDTARFTEIVQSSNDAIIGKSLNRIITSWNPGAEQLYGYTADEAIGQHISLIFPSDDSTIEWQLLNFLKKGQKIKHYETRRRRKDGSEIDISLTISPIRTADGQITGYSTIERDISVQKQLESLRLETERRLREVLNNLALFVGVMTPEGILIEANHSALEAARLQPSDVIGRPFEQAYWWSFSEASQARLRESIAKAAQGETVRYDVEVRLADDHFITIDFMIAPVLDDQQRVKYLVPSGIDVTERNRLSAQLDLEKRTLATILNTLPGIVYQGSGSADAGEQRMEFISEYAVSLLGYPLESWYAEPNFWKKVVHPDDWEEAVERTNDVYEHGLITTPIPFRCITQDGRILHCEAYSSVITDHAGRQIGTCGVVLDVTERREIHDLLKNYVQRLQRSNKELEQFAYIASHDLQEPLRTVTSYLQLIEQRYTDALDDDGRDFIDFAVDGATRMKTLINDLLSYSRVQRDTSAFTNVDMQQVFDQVLYNLQITIEDTCSTITHDELPSIIANEGQMVQLLQNLVGNSLKFRQSRPLIVHVGVERRSDDWVFYVQDNGIGIQPEYRERIFTLFQRLHTRDQYSGTGIGLAICRKIVTEHGGEIWVESQPGEGTTFYFSIPVKATKGLSSHAQY